MKTSLLILLFLGLNIYLFGQCDVRIHTPKTVLCVGDTIPMEAKGGCGIALFIDFNDSTSNPATTTNFISYNNVCEQAMDSTAYAWFGTSPGSNELQTPAVDVSFGSFTVCFEMKYGEDGLAGSCNGPSNSSESVSLQYSINAGATWVNLQTWDPNGGHDANLIHWKKYCVSLPSAAKTTATRFRWVQSSNNIADDACWGLDNIMISKYVPTQFVWSTGHNGSTHPQISPINNITYYVTATSGAFSSVDSVSIQVLPRPTSFFSIDPPYCKNTWLNVNYLGNADTTQAQFFWTFNQSNNVDTLLPYNPKVMWNKTGQFKVSLSVKQGICASNNKVKEILVGPLISFFIQNNQGCEPLTVSFQGNVEPLNSSYLWDFKDGSTDTSKNPTHTYQQAGNYGLSLIAETDSGCIDTINFPVLSKVYPKPKADFNWSPEIVPWSDPIAIFNDLSQQANFYDWDFGDAASGSNSSGNPSPNHSFTQKGLYDVWLKVESDKGCRDSIMKVVRVADDEFKIPNVITPNGDGINEVLEIENFSSLKQCSIQIFNRWGQLIYHSANYDNKWDAFDIPDGVYFYKVHLISWFGEQEVYGFFHILRD